MVEEGGGFGVVSTEDRVSVRCGGRWVVRMVM